MVLACIKLEKIKLTRTLPKQEKVPVPSLWFSFPSPEIICRLFLHVPKVTGSQWNTNRPGTNFKQCRYELVPFAIFITLVGQPHCSEGSSGLSSSYTQLSFSVLSHSCPSWPQCVPSKQMLPNPCLKTYFRGAQASVQSKWMDIPLKGHVANALKLLASFQLKGCIKAVHSTISH